MEGWDSAARTSFSTWFSIDLHEFPNSCLILIIYVNPLFRPNVSHSLNLTSSCVGGVQVTICVGSTLFAGQTPTTLSTLRRLQLLHSSSLNNLLRDAKQCKAMLLEVLKTDLILLSSLILDRMRCRAALTQGERQLTKQVPPGLYVAALDAKFFFEKELQEA